VIRFESVSYAYPGHVDETPALREITLSITENELVAVLGANGSGKSTLALLANGLVLPVSGSVTVDGIDTRDEDRGFDVRARVGLVLQNPDNQIVATTVEEDVAFGPENLGMPRDEIRSRVDGAIAAVGLGGLERREPHLLSGGQKQRLAIAGVLALDPRYLILDEPASMLDAAGRREFEGVLGRLRAEGRGIVLITHDLATVAEADRAVVLDGGEVAFDGELAGLLAEPARLASWGLALPPVGVLAAELRARGIDVPLSAITPVAVAEALCR
jgi:energy-coupling factor transport system ATP-binding protein